MVFSRYDTNYLTIKCIAGKIEKFNDLYLIKLRINCGILRSCVQPDIFNEFFFMDCLGNSMYSAALRLRWKRSRTSWRLLHVVK